MRLYNETDLPADVIRAAVRAVRPPGIGGFDLRVTWGPGSGSGRAYAEGAGFRERACPYVVVRLPRTEAAARKRWRAKGAYLEIVVGSRLEALVALLAHELRHIWQARHSRGRVFGARGRYSERDADAYALQRLRLRRYRRGELRLAGER